MNNKIFYVLVGLLVTLPLVVQAATFIIEDENRTPVTKSTVPDDLYIFGNAVAVKHAVEEDLVAGGNTVTIDADVGNDLHAGGNVVRFDGKVGDDAFLGGNTVTANFIAVDDVFVGGNMAEVKAEEIKGDVYMGGTQITLQGNIVGTVHLSGSKITIREGTTIGGDLITYGDAKPVLEDNVSVAGETRQEMDGAGRSEIKKIGVGGWVLNVLVWFTAALVLLLVFPNYVQKVIDNTFSSGGKALGVGFVWLFAALPVTVVLFISVIGWPLALLTVFVTGEVIITAMALSGVVIGVWVMKYLFKREGRLSWQHVLLGVVTLKIVQFIPFVGWLLALVVMIITLGASILACWKIFRQNKKETAPSV